MKKFQFRLDGLLRVRKVETDRRRGELQQRLSRALETERALQELVNERDRSNEKLLELASGSMEMVEVLAYQRYLNALYRKENELSSELIAQRRETLQAQQELGEALRGQQVVERLRERRQEEYKDEVAREERLELDEIGQNLRNTLALKEQSGEVKEESR